MSFTSWVPFIKCVRVKCTKKWSFINKFENWNFTLPASLSSHVRSLCFLKYLCWEENIRISSNCKKSFFDDHTITLIVSYKAGFESLGFVAAFRSVAHRVGKASELSGCNDLIMNMMMMMMMRMRMMMMMRMRMRMTLMMTMTTMKMMILVTVLHCSIEI